METSGVLHRKRHLGHLWALQLSESLSWSILKSRYISRGHINVQEVKAHKDLIRHIDRDMRIVFLQDSRVCLGCSSKGRSGSKALNSHLRSEAAYLLGKNLHVGGAYCPTWSIRADDPSRLKPVREPRSAVPVWLWKLRKGIIMPCLSDNEMCHRALGRWFLLGCLVLSFVRRGCATAAHPNHVQSNFAGRHGKSIPNTKEETSNATSGGVDANKWAAASVAGAGQAFSLVSGGLAAELQNILVRWEKSDERSNWEVSFREGPPWRSVEINCYLEDAGTQSIS